MKNHTTTDSFPKAGDDEAQVVNVSGAPSPNTLPADRKAGGPTSAELGSDDKSNRTPVEIDAESGQLYDSGTQARARQVWSKAADQLGDPRSRTLLGNILGLDTGLDRA